MTKFQVFLLTCILLIACKKDPNVIIPGPNPGPTDPPASSSTFQFALDELPGETLPLTEELFAVVTIADQNGAEVVANKKVRVDYQGKFKTDPLLLVDGNYTLTKFLLVNSNGIIRFATPYRNAAKANGMNHPLAIGFSLEKIHYMDVPVEVLRVQANDQDEHFGYPSGTFKFANQPPPNVPENNTQSIAIKVKVEIRVGEVVYDDVPGFLRVNSLDSDGRLHYSSYELRAGINEIRLPSNRERFQLSVSKWGVEDEITLQKNEIDPSKLYKLGGSKEAKKLKYEHTYRLNDGKYEADNRVEYYYNADGTLKHVLYFDNKLNDVVFLTYSLRFVYQNKKLQKIDRMDADNNLVGHTRFTYDATGKLVGMVEELNNQTTTATVEYSNVYRNEVILRYAFSDKHYTAYYNKTFSAGNMVRGDYATSHHDSRQSQYQYDNGINPYVHIQWPDLYLTHSSKNNVTAQQNSFSGGRPESAPYSFAYTYDSEGFPKEVIRKYQSGLSHLYLFTTKTIYNYH